MSKKKKKERKQKKKLTPEQRREKKRRKAEFMIIFINGKQKRVRRQTSYGLNFGEFPDQIWLHQNERWEDMEPKTEPPIPQSSVSDSEIVNRIGSTHTR